MAWGEDATTWSSALHDIDGAAKCAAYETNATLDRSEMTRTREPAERLRQNALGARESGIV